MQINWNRLKQLNSIRINFIGILQEDNGAIMFFKIEKLEETTFNFTKFCKYHITWKCKRL